MHYYFINFIEGLFPCVSKAHCEYTSLHKYVFTITDSMIWLHFDASWHHMLRFFLFPHKIAANIELSACQLLSWKLWVCCTMDKLKKMNNYLEKNTCNCCNELHKMLSFLNAFWFDLWKTFIVFSGGLISLIGDKS